MPTIFDIDFSESTLDEHLTLNVSTNPLAGRWDNAQAYLDTDNHELILTPGGCCNKSGSVMMQGVNGDFTLNADIGNGLSETLIFVFGWIDAFNYYYIANERYVNDPFKLYRVINGVETQIDSYYNDNAGINGSVELSVIDNLINFKVDDIPYFSDVTFEGNLSDSSIFIFAGYGGGVPDLERRVVVTHLTLNSIETGWTGLIEAQSTVLGSLYRDLGIGLIDNLSSVSGEMSIFTTQNFLARMCIRPIHKDFLATLKITPYKISNFLATINIVNPISTQKSFDKPAIIRINNNAKVSNFLAHIQIGLYQKRIPVHGTIVYKEVDNVNPVDTDGAVKFEQSGITVRIRGGDVYN